MSRADDRDYEMADRIDVHPSQSEPNFVDSSWPLYVMYSEIAEEEDNKIVERWQKDAEGMIIFTGLFSAAVAAMISVSIQDLKPNPQDTSVFYLKQIYLIQADPNASHPFNSSAVAEPPVFSPPNYAVLVNALWFLSLVISLASAMVATLVQQWTRRYIKVTRPPRCNPQKRAQAHAFFTIGVGKFRLPSVVEKLLAMVHLSLLFFFLGLIGYLAKISSDDHVVFNTIAFCTVIILAVYVCITFMSRYWPDCPYYTPFSWKETTIFLNVLIIPIAIRFRNIAGLVCTGILFILHVFGRWANSGKITRNWIFLDTEVRVEEAISRRSSELDTHVLDLTLDALGEDDAREKFLEFLPGFYRSDVVNDLRQCLPKNVQSKIRDTLDDLFSRTLLSNSFTGFVKLRRLATCLAAADEIDTSAEFESGLQITTCQNWSAMPRSAEFGEFLRSWDKGKEGRYTQWIISGVIADVYASERDDRWIALAMDHLGIPEHVLRGYLAHGDSVLLALIIHSTRHAIRSNFSQFCLLPPLSEFDVHNTSPGLQHEFCDLWNTLARNVRDCEDPSSSISILKAIRPIYVALHQGSDAASTVLDQPSSYPLCNIPDHHPDSIIQVQDATVPAVEASHAPAANPITSFSESESLRAAESRQGDSTPRPAEPPPDDLPPPGPITPVESSATASTHAIIHRSSILASAIPDRPDPPPLAMACIIGAPQHNINEDHHPEFFSVEHGALASSSLISRHSDVLTVDAQSSASQADQSSVAPPPSPATTLPLPTHQGTSILDHNVALNDTEPGVQDDPRTTDPPASTVTTHCLYSPTSDHDLTSELSSSSRLLAGDPASPHDSDYSQL